MLIDYSANKHEPAYLAVSGGLYGYPYCCGVGVIARVLGKWTTVSTKLERDISLAEQTKDITHVNTLRAYRVKYMPLSQFGSYLALPIDFCFAMFLELMYEKITTGDGGANMYGGASFHTGVFSLTDRSDGEQRGLRTITLMNWLEWHCKENNIGVCNVFDGLPTSSLSTKGKLKIMTFSPHVKECAAFLNPHIARLNKHLNEVQKIHAELPSLKDLQAIQIEERALISDKKLGYKLLPTIGTKP